MGIDRPKIIRTWRLALTCISLFLITWYYQVPESAWAMVTIWFLMYEYTTVGGVLTKSFLRFAGTTLSAIYGMIIVYCCGNNPIINIMALIPGLFVYTYFFMGGDKTYIGTIGAVTLTIVLLNYNDIDTAVLRVLNVVIGIIGSMVMIRFFYPQYARDKVMELQFLIIGQLIHLLECYLDHSQSLATMQIEYLNFEQKFLDQLTVYARFISEAKVETKKAPFFIPHSLTAMQHFRHLFRLFSVFIYHISTEELRSDAWVREQLNHILIKLNNLQRTLLLQEKQKIPAITAKTQTNDEENPDATVLPPAALKYRQATETIFTHMQQQIDLLDVEINKIILIYTVYDIEFNSG